MANVNRMTLRSGPRRPAPDFSRFRRQFSGKPKNYVSYGVVGHYDQNPAFARVEDGKVLVEVTLVPSGDEIVARLGDQGGGDGVAEFRSIMVGMRVVVAFPQGENDSPVIVCRVNDSTWPFPSSVAGIPTSPIPVASFTKTPEGSMYILETGEGGDVILRSGASFKISVSPSEQVLIGGTTHIGKSVDFASPPIPPTISPTGEYTEGVEGAPFAPTPNSNSVVPPALAPSGKPLPADGIVRLKDRIQSNPSVDSTLFEWINTVTLGLIQIATILNAAPGPVLSAPGTVTGIPLNVPQTIESLPRQSSTCTAGDS